MTYRDPDSGIEFASHDDYERQRRGVCPRCDGDGYTETWNDDQSDVIITLCPDCSGGVTPESRQT